MKYLGTITDDKDLVTKKYVDDAAKVVQTLTSGTEIGSVGGTKLYAPQGGGGGGAETDPIFAASAAAGISSSDISNWNNKVDKVSSSATSFTIGGIKFMWGSVSINLSSGSSGSGTYATPYRKDSGSISLSFSDVPYVWVTIAGSWTGTNIAHPLDITATSMKIRLLSSAKPDNSKTIRWLAIGKA